MSHLSDVESVLARRHDNGGDFWASADGRLGVGSPFSTLESLLILHELGVTREHEAIRGALDLLLGSWREDGRFSGAPGATRYPCTTANVARVLCRFGLADDHRVQRSLSHLIETHHADGGWRCARFLFGRGPETDFSNPGVTLFALDAFRFSERHLYHTAALDRAVESLLAHWVAREPRGPCHFGIGTLFMQVEYPFLRYNLLFYVYVLSFYARARADARFLEALDVLRRKSGVDGQLVVERPNRKLSPLESFAKGRPSEAATRRWREILANVE